MNDTTRTIFEAIKRHDATYNGGQFVRFFVVVCSFDGSRRVVLDAYFRPLDAKYGGNKVPYKPPILEFIQLINLHLCLKETE